MFLLDFRPLTARSSRRPAQLSGFVFAVLLSAASLPAQDTATVKTSESSAPQEAKVTHLDHFQNRGAALR